MTQVLVTAQDLVEEMLSDRPPVVLDIRWTLQGADREGFRSGHIPGALFVDLDAELADHDGPATLGRHPLPDPEALQKTWRRVGIMLGDAVVVYDAKESSAAARAWWLLRWSGLTNVRVLDGGLAAWEGAGLRVKAGDGTPAVPGGIRVRPGGMPVLDPDEAATYAGQSSAVLLDARAAARFRGEVEPIDPKAGHIPGAVNLPFTDLLEPDGTFRDREELQAIFADRGVVPGTVVGASCGSGVTACHLVLAAAIADIEVALFPGSWSAWCALDLPVEIGAGAHA